MSLLLVGTAAGILSLVVGIPAMIFGGYFSDKISARFPGGRMAFTSSAALISIPLWIALLFVNQMAALIAVNIVVYALALMWVGPATADVHDIAGPRLRGLGIGVFFSVVNVVAYGVGSPLIGKVSDLLGGNLRYSLLVCPAACALGALLLWMGSRSRVAAAAAQPAPERGLAVSES